MTENENFQAVREECYTAAHRTWCSVEGPEHEEWEDSDVELVDEALEAIPDGWTKREGVWVRV